MSEVGSWEPGAAQSQLLEPQFLRSCLQRFADCPPAELGSRFPPEEQRRYAGIMRCPWSSWRELAARFSDAEVRQLIRFLTLAEMHFAAWRADQHSPVIPLARMLRERGQELEREFLLWIREHSDNRYLPYGPLLPETEAQP